MRSHSDPQRSPIRRGWRVDRDHRPTATRRPLRPWLTLLVFAVLGVITAICIAILLRDDPTAPSRTTAWRVLLAVNGFCVGYLLSRVTPDRRRR